MAGREGVKEYDGAVMWVIRVNRRFYAQGANPRWYSDPEVATHFYEDQDAHDEARDVLGLEPADYLVEPVYPRNPRPANGGAGRPVRA